MNKPSCILLFLLLSFSVFSQGKVSEKQFGEWQDKSRMFLNSNIDSSMVYAKKIMGSEDLLHKAFASGIIAYIQQLKGDVFLSDASYLQSVQFLAKSRDSRKKKQISSYVLNYAGLIGWKRNNLSTALESYLSGKKLSQEISDWKQLIKFNNNIALLNIELGNFEEAIKALNQSEKLLLASRNEYSHSQFLNSRSNVHINLGNAYDRYYLLRRDLTFLQDSALLNYEKAISYSDALPDNKITAQINVASIYKARGEFGRAEENYFSMIARTRSLGLHSDYCNVAYNLGDLYFMQKKFEKALFFFKKVDSVYAEHPSGRLEYIKSNYYQAKIYDHMGDAEKASAYSEKYLQNLDRLQWKLKEERLHANYRLEQEKMRREMQQVKSKGKKSTIWKYLLAIVVILGTACLALLRRKKRHSIGEGPKVGIHEQFESKPSSQLNIDDGKEEDILSRLESLEAKKYYLSSDFTLPHVAKKIKTNTTYLSYVVNKRFGKSFSEYSNQLKINHVLEELSNNPTYRKYSTQAIAESVGFKNAVSFTRSFTKRVGVSPTQFTKNLKGKN